MERRLSFYIKLFFSAYVSPAKSKFKSKMFSETLNTFGFLRFEIQCFTLASDPLARAVDPYVFTLHKFSRRLECEVVLKDAPIQLGQVIRAGHLRCCLCEGEITSESIICTDT